MATGSAQYEHVQSRDNSRMHNGNNNNYNYTTNNTAFFHVPKKPPSDPIHAGLIRACAERARTPRLHYLLSQGADIDHTDGIGCTPLHHAVSSGSMETIRAVVNAGADVNAVDEWYGTPLCLASSRGNLEIVDFLIKSHADTKKHCGSLGSAAHAACARGDLPVMRALHAARANWKTERSVCVDAFCYLSELSQDNGTLVTYHKSLASRNYHIQSPGAMAVKYRHPEAVEFCFGLADGPSVNEAWKDARNPSDGKCAVTLLMLAMSTLDAGTAELLLKHGADAAAVDRTGRSALIYALRPFDLEVTDTADLKKCVGLLIRHVDIINHLHLINDETITVTDVARMLWDIVWWPGSVAVLASMLNDPSKWGMTALMHTIHRHSDHLSRVTCVKVLCELGANVKRRNIHRHSALDFARCYPPSTEKDEVMEILMRYA